MKVSRLSQASVLPVANMGYDSNECLVCYCGSGGNNPVSSEMLYNVCSTCYWAQCREGLRGRAGLSSYAKVFPGMQCNFCSGHAAHFNTAKRELQDLSAESADACGGYVNTSQREVFRNKGAAYSAQIVHSYHTPCR
jgi:hypothetical protein